MLQDIFEWIVSSAGAALGATVVHGFPAWGKPTLTPPVAALEIATWSPGLPTRIGQARARQSASFTFYLFARNELELLAMLGSFAAWGLGNASVEIDGRRVDVGLSDGLRYQSETGTQQEEYAFQVTLSSAWSE